MNRLSIGTISALFLAGAVAPAAFANVGEGLRSQNQTVSQLPGQPQTPAQSPTPGQGSGQTLPGQTPGQGPGQFPPGQNQAPGQTPGQMQTPGQPRSPGQVQPTPGQGSGQTLPGQTPGQGPGHFPPGQSPTQQRSPGTTQTPSTEFRGMGTGTALAADQVSPFQLTYMAIRGDLEGEGMGGPASMLQDLRRGSSQGEAIVEAAVAQGYISSDLQEDRGYINQVNQVLRMRSRDFR